MQKKNAGIARSFALKGLLLLAALTLGTGFFACKVAVSGDSGGTEVPSVTLTFDAGEGSFKEGKTLTLTGKAGENLALTETPVREGYNFTGWNPALPEKYPEKDTEYTAVWVKEGDYTITYVNVDGATNENPASYNVETETITLKDPVKPGYTFGGWYKDGEFTTQVTEITQGTTGDIILYAKWELESYPITYVLDGGTNAPENPASYNVETGTITLKDPVKTGYTFAGWYKDGEFTSKVTEITQGTTGNITLYAKWELVSYTITYELDGGNNVPENPAGYNVETGTITLKDPVKTEYTFAGWYSADNSPVTKITQGSTGDITLYAKWVTDIEGKVFVRGGDATLNGKEVTFSSFWISPYEVTQGEFVSVMTGNKNGIEYNPSWFQGEEEPPADGEVQERRPVERVSWYDAIVYCNLLSIKEGLTPCYTIKGSTDPAAWGTSPTSTSAVDYADWESVTCNFNANGYRLPTEAEWEYAARGGQAGITDGSWDNTYSGSNTRDDVAWNIDNCGSSMIGKTHEVGKKQPNSLGLYDMSGNVFEWCWDWYGDDYPCGTEDPAGPDTGSYRVIRGGSTGSDGISGGCYVSGRYYYPFDGPCQWLNNVGFRVVRSAQ